MFRLWQSFNAGHGECPHEGCSYAPSTWVLMVKHLRKAYAYQRSRDKRPRKNATHQLDHGLCHIHHPEDDDSFALHDPELSGLSMLIGGKRCTVLPRDNYSVWTTIPDQFEKWNFVQSEFLCVNIKVQSAIESDWKYEWSHKEQVILTKMKGTTTQACILRYRITCEFLFRYHMEGLHNNGAVLKSGLRVPWGVHLMPSAGVFEFSISNMIAHHLHFNDT